MLTIPSHAADRFSDLFWSHLDDAVEACALIEDYAPAGRAPGGSIDGPGLTDAQRLYLFHLAQQMAQRNEAAVAQTHAILERMTG